SDDAFFLPERPHRVVLLGGGYVALEFAAVFAGLGSEVDVVYRQMLPLRGFDEDLRAGVAEALPAEGVRIHPGSRPTSVEVAGGEPLPDGLSGPGPRVGALDRGATAVFSIPPVATVGLTEHEAALRGPADIYLSRFTPMRHALTGRARKTMMKLVVDQATQKV